LAVQYEPDNEEFKEGLSKCRETADSSWKDVWSPTHCHKTRHSDHVNTELF
jgi:hypothetical protein